jgi:hypothetical protein
VEALAKRTILPVTGAGFVTRAGWRRRSRRARKLVRFGPGELDPYVPEIRRLPDDAPIFPRAQADRPGRAPGPGRAAGPVGTSGSSGLDRREQHEAPPRYV